MELFGASEPQSNTCMIDFEPEPQEAIVVAGLKALAHRRDRLDRLPCDESTFELVADPVGDGNSRDRFELIGRDATEPLVLCGKL